MEQKEIDELRALITGLRFEVANLKDRVFMLESKDQKFGPLPTYPVIPNIPYDPIIY